MIGDLKREFCDSGGLGMRVEKDPLQVGNIMDGVLYSFGDSTIEIDFIKVDEVPVDHPFARIIND